MNADLAQLVEQLIRNEQVVGSSPIIGSLKVKSPSLLGKEGLFSVCNCLTLQHLQLLAATAAAQHVEPGRQPTQVERGLGDRRGRRGVAAHLAAHRVE